MHKNQQNSSKSNPTLHQNYQSPRSSWIRPRDTRMVTNKEINKCSTLHQQNEECKLYDDLNRYREIIS